jgi:hypothetical protein
MEDTEGQMKNLPFVVSTKRQALESFYRRNMVRHKFIKVPLTAV